MPRATRPIRDEGPSPEDVDRFADATRTCPHCHASLYDDAEICYKCGQALDAPSCSRWIPLTAVLLVVVILLSVLLGLWR